MKEQFLLQSNPSDPLKLKNTVVMAPMTRSRGANEDKKTTAALHGRYYAQRASAGLSITEDSQIIEEAIRYVKTPGIHYKAKVTGWKEVTKEVHEKDGKLFMQLGHIGRMSHRDFPDGELPLECFANHIAMADLDKDTFYTPGPEGYIDYLKAATAI